MLKTVTHVQKNITIRDIPYMYGNSKRSGKLLNLIAAVEIFYQCFGKCIIQ